MDIDFKFIGWVNETEPNGSKHDKVWTAFRIGNDYYAAWGARGKKLNFKHYGAGFLAGSEQSSVMRQKKKKYKVVDNFLLFTVFPTFQEDVEKHLVFATLANKVK